MEITPAFFQHLLAPNDTNGNPRRCFVVYNTDFRVHKVYDEGYYGKSVLPEEIRRLPEIASIDVSAQEYRIFLKLGE